MWLWRLTRQNILLSLFSHKWQWHTKQNRGCYCRPFPPSQIKPITTKLHQCRHHGQTQCGSQWLKLAENKFTRSDLMSFSNQVFSRSKCFRFRTLHEFDVEKLSNSRHKFDHINFTILLKSNFLACFCHLAQLCDTTDCCGTVSGQAWKVQAGQVKSLQQTVCTVFRNVVWGNEGREGG